MADSLRLSLLLALLTLGAVGKAAHAVNALIDHPSPYLAMHGQDPVHWQDWGPRVMAAARQENRLILVSSGYFACHWCHVMQRESYRSSAIAAFLNRHFIAVKVDRELQPALDAYLIEFVTRTQGQAGWPLNVILTPEGFPLIGFTYLPAEHFLDVLVRLQSRWEQEATQLQGLAKAAAELIARPAAGRVEMPREPGNRLRAALRKEALELADPLAGGFGQQNKFPSAPQLMALLAGLDLDEDPELAAFLITTLDAMAEAGLRDHLGGGFFRYTVDPNWQTPHFEKMLYTQALMIILYLDAAERLRRPDYRQVALDTLRFLLDAFAAPGGGYIASFSAVDGAGTEGGYYLWAEDQVSGLLSASEQEVINRVWALSGPPSLDAGHLPIPRSGATGLSPGNRSRFDSARAKLLAVRGKRTLPADHKVVAGWNGLVLSALARALKSGHGDHVREAGEALNLLLLERFRDGEGLRRDLARAGQVGLEDYAYVARGLVDWAKVSGERAGEARARQLVDLAWKAFHSNDGWRLGKQSLLPAIPGEAAVGDGPMPSPAAILLGLFSGDGEAHFAARHEALASAYEAVAESPFWYASYSTLYR